MLDVLAGVRLDFFYTSGAQNIAKKRYMKCWSAVSIRTEAARYKWLVQVSPIFSAFAKSFLELLSVFK